MRDQIRGRLSQSTLGEFTKNICFIPTEQRLIQNMIQICFQDQEDTELIAITESVFQQLKQIIHNKGKHVEKENEK